MTNHCLNIMQCNIFSETEYYPHTCTHSIYTLAQVLWKHKYILYLHTYFETGGHYTAMCMFNQLGPFEVCICVKERKRESEREAPCAKTQTWFLSSSQFLYSCSPCSWKVTMTKPTNIFIMKKAISIRQIIKKIEMATRLLYTGPLSSKLESMALQSILEKDINHKIKRYTHKLKHKLVPTHLYQKQYWNWYNSDIFSLQDLFIKDIHYHMITHFGHPSNVEMVKRASMPLNTLSKFRSELVHSLLWTSTS